MSILLAYCREGAEADLTLELMTRVRDLTGVELVSSYERTGGVVALEARNSKRDLVFLKDKLLLKNLIFARQLIFATPSVVVCDGEDRTAPLVNALELHADTVIADRLYSDLIVEYADTNAGKELAKFCRKFELPLTNRLKKAGFKKLYSSKNAPRIHVLFLDYEHAFIGVSYPHNSSPHPQGIVRLKFPEDAPSRSTLKLEEAFHQFMNEEERHLALREGMTAVDLGAAPGGWTYQFFRRKIKVYAIDNGKMSAIFKGSSLVKHLAVDAYRYEPDQIVDWMVCDMVDRPQQVAELVGRWLESSLCHYVIANLKLPMKNRFEAVMDCIDIIRQRAPIVDDDYEILIKQLYHDREEVTIMFKPKSEPFKKRSMR